MTKIALLSDIHGNTTALEAVLEDAKRAGVEEYWLLGDVLMPGTGRRHLLNLLEELPITVQILGNWEDSLWRAMKGMLDPEYEEKIIGEALIRETFKVSKVGTIGGFMVINGKVTRDSKVRVIRDGVVIYDGELASLKHFKDDVKEVTNGREGGLMIDGYNDIQVDDTIEAYIMEEIKK